MNESMASIDAIIEIGATNQFFNQYFIMSLAIMSKEERHWRAMLQMLS
jgi:hypothetical protein